MIKKSLTFLLLLSLAGCGILQKTGLVDFKPEIPENRMQREFDTINGPESGKITVAVYGFKDLTGQRRNIPNVASFSTAVTQGAEPFLIKSLQDVGKGQWFDVVERVNVDNLIRERTIIRQMREAYEGKNAQPLPPMQFAGILMEGGIIGYDTSTESGGAAYRWLGIGPQTQYSKDTITISLRAVSVGTGKVLASVDVTKVIYSTADSVAMVRFWNGGTQAFEAEAGITQNESGTMAVRWAIQSAVVELLKEGHSKGVWRFKQ
jgi:curli production assembly/transport component CsgG